jgi:hypothetical protein
MTTPFHHFSEIDNLCSWIISEKGQRDRFVVGFDGLDGTGKTSIAQLLSAKMGTTCVSLDHHIEKNTGRFIDAIQCADLQVDILMAYGQVLLIEGVCLLAVTVKCQIPINKHVYVRRLSALGIWHDEETCNPTTTAENLKNEALALRGAGSSDLGLEGELIDYHCQYKPYEKADVIFDVRF